MKSVSSRQAEPYLRASPFIIESPYKAVEPMISTTSSSSKKPLTTVSSPQARMPYYREYPRERR